MLAELAAGNPAPFDGGHALVEPNAAAALNAKTPINRAPSTFIVLAFGLWDATVLRPLSAMDLDYHPELYESRELLPA